MGFLTPLYPIVMEKFGLSLSLVGAVSMVAALASALSQPLFGMLFDRFGVSASLYLAPLLTGVLVSFLGPAPSFTVFLVLLFLGCLGSAAFHPKGASVTPAVERQPPRGRHGGIQRRRQPRVRRGPRRDRVIHLRCGASTRLPSWPCPPCSWRPASLCSCRPGSCPEERQHAARTTWKELFADRADLIMLLRLVFINFCLNVSTRGLSTFLPVYMAQHGASVTSIGILFTVMLALGALISVFVSNLSRRTGKRVLILVSAAAGAPLAVGGYLLFPSAAGSSSSCWQGPSCRSPTRF